MFSAREECGNAEPSPNPRVKVTPNWFALWTMERLPFAFQKPKTPVWWENDKCQKLLIYFKVQRVRQLLLFDFRHLSVPARAQWRLFLHLAYIRSVGFFVLFFVFNFWNHCGFSSSCTCPNPFAAETSVVNVAGSHVTAMHDVFSVSWWGASSVTDARIVSDLVTSCGAALLVFSHVSIYFFLIV